MALALCPQIIHEGKHHCYFLVFEDYRERIPSHVFKMTDQELVVHHIRTVAKTLIKKIQKNQKTPVVFTGKDLFNAWEAFHGRPTVSNLPSS